MTTTQRTEHRHKVHARKQREARKRAKNEEQFAQLPGGVTMATLESIAACESGGNPEAVSSEGTYRGKYQFDQGTWESVGGSGDPAAAPGGRTGLPRRAPLLGVRLQPLADLRLTATVDLR